MKVCYKCKIEKDFTNFCIDKRSKDGLQEKCKNCNKEYRKANKERILEYNKKYNKIWNELNKNYFKKYYILNKEKKLEYSKKYNLKNKNSIKEYKKEYQYNRKKSDPLYKFICNIRSLIGGSFKRGNNQFRKDAKTENILGCTVEEFKSYIESKFTEGMTLENYGKWHLDHIHPISLAKTEEEIIKLNHYTNFQPLWAEENIRKGNRLDY